jgi:hypothetical protein
MIQKLTCFVLLFILCAAHRSNAQHVVSPALNSPACPLQPGGNPYGLSNMTSDLTFDSPKGCTIVNNLDGQGHFVLSFTDVKEEHSVRLISTTGNTVIGTYKFTNINTLDGLTPKLGAAPPLPPPPGYNDVIIVPICTTTSFNYTGLITKYKDAAGTEYGNGMSFYDFLPPAGWKVNGVTCNGTTPIMVGGAGATITPDPINGGGSAIKIRARNDCDANNLKPSGWFQVYISRATAKLSSAGATAITIACGDYSTRVFTLENAAGCITSYVWNLGAGNGWLYNGSAAPATITTSTNSLSLVPAVGGTPGNVSLSLVVNGMAYPTTYTVGVTFTRTQPGASLSGPSALCSAAQTYSLSSLPGGTSFTWSVTGGLQIVSGQGTSSAQVQPTVSSGQGTVQVLISSPCFNSFTLSKNVTVGVPDASKLSIVSQGLSVCPNVPIGFGARYSSNCSNFADAGITNVNWTVSPSPAQIVLDAGTTGCSHGNNSAVTIRFFPNPTQYSVRITAENACGVSGLSSPLGITIMTGGICTMSAMTVSPNPSSGQVLVSLPQTGTAPAGAVNARTVTTVSGQPVPSYLVKQVDVYNETGVLVKSFQYGTGKTGTLMVDLGDMPQGIYIMSVNTNKGRFTQKVKIIK